MFYHGYLYFVSGLDALKRNEVTGIDIYFLKNMFFQCFVFIDHSFIKTHSILQKTDFTVIKFTVK